MYPAEFPIWQNARPIYEELQGWQTDITAIRDYKKLPAQAKKFISRIEELLSCPIHIVSVGAKREQTIFRKKLLYSAAVTSSVSRWK